jgi:predicted metallopeptidase
MASAAPTADLTAQTPMRLHWHQAHQPLPLRSIRSPGPPPALAKGMEAPPWHTTGPANRPFHFCGAVRRLCADIVARTPELAHVDVARLLIATTQARNGRPYGLQARVTPLRFRGGALARRQRGVTFQVQRYFVDGTEVLYLMTFCLPRFLNQEFDDKFVTLFHELYHVSPTFDGDLRRHGGRCEVHTRSQRRYDEQMARLARAYLASRPDPDLHAFLRLSFAQLAARHGSVLGVVVPRPKMVPVPAPPPNGRAPHGHRQRA